MKYWAYVNNEILGPFEKEQLRGLPAFSPSLLVCPQTPVGEKTEDWKEASVYPELVPSAEVGPQDAPPPAAREPEAAPEPRVSAAPSQEPAIEPSQPGFKPLVEAKPVEPVPPASHIEDFGNISISHFNKQAGTESAPAAAPETPEPAQASSSFDPVSLSQIVRRAENIPTQETPGENLAPEPAAAAMPRQPEQPATPGEPVPAAQTPEPEQKPAAEPPVKDLAGLESLVQRLDAISRNAATKKDIDSALDPVKFKLDQMGEVINSIKNSGFQKDVIEKLAYLENAVGELKAAARTAGAAAPAHAAEAPSVSLDSNRFRMEKTPAAVFGAKPESNEKAPAPAAKEPAKGPEPQEIKDLGSKRAGIGSALKKAVRFVFTLVLLAAVLIVAAFGLRNFGIFDVTEFIPFPLPFITQAPPEQPAPGTPADTQEQIPAEAAAGQPQAAETAQPAPAEQEAAQEAPGEAARGGQAFSPKPVPPEVVPQVIYITRTFKLKNSAETLENKIYGHAAKAGGNFSSTNWEVVSAPDGRIRVTAVIPAKDKNLRYPYLVDKAKKTVEPDAPEAKAAYDDMAADKVRRAPRPPRKKSAAKPAPKPAQKAEVLKPAAEDDSEYEYVYVDEDGYEEPAGK